MKETFEKRLRDYGEVAKDQIDNDFELNKELETVLKWHLDKGAEFSKTQFKPQVDIYTLQLEKQVIMENLKKDIKSLDNSVPQKDVVGKKVLKSEEVFLLPDSNESLTLGEIMTDSEWNIDYSLDPGSVPRNIRKKYLIERAKSKLQSLLDDQIAINEKESENVDIMKREAYRRSHKEKGEGLEKAGLLAEKMVRNLLRKITIDLGADFELEKADLYQDINQKIDFIVKRKTRERGVKIEEGKENLGIQFTINTREDIKKHKEKQIERSKKELIPEDHIQDIVLVSIPIKEINSVYDQWKKDKKPGGPDKLWSVEDKRRIFSEIMKGFLSSEEIKEYSEKIK